MKTKMLSRLELSFRIVSNLWIIDDDQAAEVGVEDVLQLVPAVGPPDRDVVGLHLAEKSVDPSLELALQLGAVDDEDDGCVLEAVLLSRGSTAQPSAR